MAEPGPLRQLFRSAWWVVLNLVGLVLVGQWLWEVVQGLQPLLLVAAGLVLVLSALVVWQRWTPCPSGMARITVHRDQGADNKDGSVSRFPVRHFRPPPSVMSTVPSTASADRQRRGDRRHQQDERS